MKGKRIAITRGRNDAAEFLAMMERYGAHPLMLPTIKLVGRGKSIAAEFLAEIKRNDPDYSIFMSSKAVKILFDAARDSGGEDELRLAVANTTVIAVGPKTRDALAGYGIRTSHMPDIYSSVGIGEVLTRIGAAGKKAIIPRSGASGPFLKSLLEKIGLGVMELHLYDVCAADEAPPWDEFSDLFGRGAIDAILFTSASSVRAFFEILSRTHQKEALIGGLERTIIVAIGPFTAEELTNHGLKNTISQVHTVRGALETAAGLLERV